MLHRMELDVVYLRLAVLGVEARGRVITRQTRQVGVPRCMLGNGGRPRDER